MPGLCGLLNHSLERSLRLVRPVSGLFMGFSRNRTCPVIVRFFWSRADIVQIANLAAGGKTYDFDPRTERRKSGMRRSNNDKTAATPDCGASFGSEMNVVRAYSRRAEIVRSEERRVGKECRSR